MLTYTESAVAWDWRIRVPWCAPQTFLGFIDCLCLLLFLIIGWEIVKTRSKWREPNDPKHTRQYSKNPRPNNSKYNKTFTSSIYGRLAKSSSSNMKMLDAKYCSGNGDTIATPFNNMEESTPISPSNLRYVNSDFIFSCS